MKHCLMQKLYGFKGGKIWRVNFLEGAFFEIFKFHLYFFKLNYIFCSLFYHKSEEYLNSK